MDFAKSHMEGKGWSEGIGLGRHGQVYFESIIYTSPIYSREVNIPSLQGITDAIKPKLKFDQSGIGHNK